MDKFERYSLNELVDVRDGTHDSPKYVNNGFPLITSKNLVNGRVDFENVNLITETDFDSINKRSKVDKGDILYSMIGSIGNFAIVNFEPRFAIKNVALFKFKNSKLSSKYFIHYIKSNEFTTQIEKQSKGGTQKFVTLKILRNIKVPLPPLPQQQKIANILDAADALRQNDKALIAKYDELTQALFLDMFGDPVSNPKGWEKVSLSEYGTFKNGLNFNNTESGVSIKYLGVGDFKSKSRIDDAESLSDIELNSLPNDGYLLKDGDLVFVRSNGNRALVGRCVEVYPKNNTLTFSGFCIRYRINSHLIKSTYLSQLFRNKSFKNLMLESGQGANIQNINQQILSSIDVPLPSLNLQKQFVNRIQAIEEQKAIAQASLMKSEELFKSLLQKAFKGEL